MQYRAVWGSIGAFRGKNRPQTKPCFWEPLVRRNDRGTPGTRGTQAVPNTTSGLADELSGTSRMGTWLCTRREMLLGAGQVYFYPDALNSGAA